MHNTCTCDLYGTAWVFQGVFGGRNILRKSKFKNLSTLENLSTLKSKYLLPPLAVTGPYPRDGVELVSKQKINSPMNIHCQGIYHKPESVPQAKNIMISHENPLMRRIFEMHKC